MPASAKAAGATLFAMEGKPQNTRRIDPTRPPQTAGSKVSHRLAHKDTARGRKLIASDPCRFVGPTGLEPMTFWV